jgi:hypothetical protein
MILERTMAYNAGKHWQNRMSLLLIPIFLFVMGSSCRIRSKSFQGYDGTWWKNTPLDQRMGFVDGFVDCHTYGCSKDSKLCKIQNDLEPAISSYYAKHYFEKSTLVGEVLIRVAETMGNPSMEGPASPALPQRTGALDGLTWIKYTPKKRLGFVEGYLNALMPQTSRSAIFPKNPQYYTDATTRFYGVSSLGPSQTGTRDDPLKQQIGKVLWSMRNQGR